MRVQPEWLITDDYTDVDLGALKPGKEAEVFLIERTAGSRSCLLAHKRYVPTEVGKGQLEAMGFARSRTFARDVPYREDKRFKRRAHREQRAAAKKTAFGRKMLFEVWAHQEYEMLSRLWNADVQVPYPVDRTSDGILMEFVGDRDAAAPALAHARLTRPELDSCYRQLVQNLEAMTAAGVVHGDLSPYNLLWWEGTLWVIDLPQAVGLLEHPQGFDLLHRDVANVCKFLDRKGRPSDADEVFAVLMACV